MPISSHLLRKLQESLGVEAATDLATIVESVEATRADVAELRHQMEIQLASMKAELKSDIVGLHAKLDAAVTRLDTRLDATVTRADLEHALLVQTRWMLGGLALVLMAILFKG